MAWLIIILAVIVLSYVRSLINKKIDGSENKKTIINEISLWDGLCQKFRKYLDFTQKTLLSDRMEIGNQKGETFTLQKSVTDIIVSYKLHGIVNKTWKFPFWVAVNTAFNNIDEYYRGELQPKASISHVQEHWRLVEERPFTKEEINAVAKTKVVKSQYGPSVEFTMVQGGVSYIPMWDKDALPIGATLDMNKAKLMRLHKDGEKDIFRVKSY